MGHYSDEREDDRTKEREERHDRATSLVFGNRPKRVYCSLESLEGVVEVGEGVNEEAAYNDYLAKLSGLILELTNKQKDIKLGLVDLEYTNVGGI